ncbi:glycosyltransferase [Ferrimonas balearica]|uniref:glycosyltransferase n=1 Tax=Ferrimonas balearica TaxID=44012 RepID=UPI001C5799BF|nr:glycosyltransferase [Ferrimonas balearica]MBW3138219.1 glycosyltransferase [Ferrimonas balearica]
MISIVTVTYNNLVGLEATASSIQSQKCTDFEWLVIDGASSDGSVEFIESFSSDNSNLNIRVLSECDKGLYDAMNKGISLAERNYIIFLNAGDLFYSESTIGDVLDKLDDSKSLLVGSSVRFDAKGHEYVKNPKSVSHLKYGMFCEHQAALFETAICKGLNYNTAYKLSADYDFFIRYVNSISMDKVKILEQSICRFEHGGVSYTKRGEAVIEDALIRVRSLSIPPYKSLLISTAHLIYHRMKVMLGWLK